MKDIKTITVLLLILSSSFALANRPAIPNPEPESMTLEQAFERLSVYEDGQSRQPIRFIEKSVYLAGSSTEQCAKLTDRFLKLLQNPEATLKAKQLACQWLVLVDDIKGVPILASMLDKPDTFEMAVGSLEKYQSHKADLELLQALDRFDGKQQIALMNALGRRGDNSAVEKLSTLLLSNDKELCKAAAINLGMIGSEKAAKLLMQADITPKEIHHDALLRCAMKLQQAQKNKEAVEVYRSLWQQKSPAGLIGLVSIQKHHAREELLEAIKSGDPILSKTAINLSSTLSDTAIDNELIELLPNASPEHKIALIRTFADGRKTAARKVVTDQLSNADDEVVLAAVEALGQLGDASSIELLANIASTQTGSRSRAAKHSLVLLDGSNVNNTIKQMIQTGKPALRAELIQAAMDRKISLQSEVLWKIVKSTDESRDARNKAVNALTMVPNPDTYENMIAFWSQLDEMSLSQAIKLAVTQLGMQLDENTRSKPLLKALHEKLHPKVLGQMLSVAGRFDHPDYIKIMSDSLQDSNPEIQLEAVRALVSWPENKGIDELIKIASTSSDTTQRILAQRALLARGESKQLSVLQRIDILKSLAASDAAENIKKQAASLQQQLKRRILLITGEDYAGHLWQQTTPVLKSLLEKDSVLQVEVLDDLSKLAAKDLQPYDALVMHFKNYDPNVPGRNGFENITKFVKDGGGLVVVHLACGAFQEFKDEFAPLAGRVYNPEFRGHDPIDKFTVNIANHQHPVTQGLKDFETFDELYTCLDGNADITVLADAVSKVDNLTYPMAFVLNYGKGRVFHCPLGHFVAAFEAEGVRELFRRGTMWVAD